MKREQLLELIKNDHFLDHGSTSKIIESMHFISKLKGGLDFYDQRPEILKVLHGMEQQRHLSFFARRPSYLASLSATAGRMAISDARFWNFMAAVLAG